MTNLIRPVHEITLQDEIDFVVSRVEFLEKKYLRWIMTGKVKSSERSAVKCIEINNTKAVLATLKRLKEAQE